MPVPYWLRKASVFHTKEVSFLARFLHHDFQRTARRMDRGALAFFWMLGLLAGGWLFSSPDNSVSSLMSLALFRQASIVGLVGVLLLPFLITAFAVLLRWQWLLRTAVFCKALSFSCVALGILYFFGEGGWLAFPLLMFSSVCSLPVLWMYWLRPGDGEWGYGALLILIGSLDYFIISPFAAAL